MTHSSASIIILGLTCSIFALACGQDEGTQPEGDSIQIVADAGPLPTADGAPAQDAAPQTDAAQPLPDGAAPPPDTVNKPDTAPPPDAKLPDAAPCNTALQGSYSAPFSLSAVEKLGSSVINKMACSGTLTAKMTCGQLPVLQGSYTCNYSGGLVIFDKQQTGTIQGKVDMSGAFAGQIKHSYNGSLKKTYSATGSITGGKLAGSGKGSLYPNPKSVVAWKVTFSF